MCWSFGQITVVGTVLDEIGESTAGATVLEIGTENGTITDLNGRFLLVTTSSEPEISIEFIGYHSQRLLPKSDTLVNVQLEVNTEALGGPFICDFPVRSTKIGANGGLINNQFGIEMQNRIPYISRLNLNLNADIKWRFAGPDNYLNTRLRKYNLFNIHRKLYIGLEAEYKSITFSNKRTRIYSLSPEFSFVGYELTVGYASRSNNLNDLEITDSGLNIELQKTYFGHLTIKAGLIHWKEDWQYVFNVLENIQNSRLSIGAGWERIEDWNEFDISILYNFRY